MDRLENGQELSNPFDDTLLHDHVCRNCGVRFYCALPDCTGGPLDPQLCPDCQTVLGDLW